jgi:UDPglucose 6-dehydrogenase
MNWREFNLKVSVVGLGKLGACMLALYASKGHKVYGVDVNQETVDCINKGLCPVKEPYLPQYLKAARDNIYCSTDYGGIKNTEITFIIVPTPTDETGEFTNRYVSEALAKVCEVIKDKKQYHLIVVTSTVKLGSMRKDFAPIMESVTKSKVNEKFGLDYNPEFIALGDVIHGLDAPDALLIGESDKVAGDLLHMFYADTCKIMPAVHRMSWENAEVSKLMLNVCVTTKISLANTITQVCDRIQGGNVDKVTAFLGADSRIGSKYIKGGLSFSGECFPRDCRAFYKMGERIGLECSLQRVNDEFNNKHNKFVLSKMLKLLPKGAKRVSLLGVSFKPNTPVTTESPAIDFANGLTTYGYEVVAYDPQGKIKEAKMKSSIKDCLQDSDLAVLVTPWSEFKDLVSEDFQVMKSPIILDCWRLLGKGLFKGTNVEYHALGLND